MTDAKKQETLGLLIKTTSIEIGIYERRLRGKEFLGESTVVLKSRIAKLEGNMAKAVESFRASSTTTTTVTPEVVADTWTDISWNVNNTCIYNGVSYTCKQQLDAKYTIQTGDSFTGVNKIAGVTGNTLKDWNQEIFEKYKVGNGYPLPAAGETIFIVDPEVTDRTPDTLNSVWWELTQ